MDIIRNSLIIAIQRHHAVALPYVSSSLDVILLVLIDNHLTIYEYYSLEIVSRKFHGHDRSWWWLFQDNHSLVVDRVIDDFISWSVAVINLCNNSNWWMAISYADGCILSTIHTHTDAYYDLISLCIGFIERLFRLKGNLLLYFKSTKRVRYCLTVAYFHRSYIHYWLAYHVTYSIWFNGDQRWHLHGFTVTFVRYFTSAKDCTSKVGMQAFLISLMTSDRDHLQ